MTTPSAAEPDAAARQRRRLRLAREMQERKRIRSLTTPEGARLELKIANASERAGAFLIDLALQLLLLFAVIFAIILSATPFQSSGWPIALALTHLLIFAIRNFYFIAFELGGKAATIGKRLLGLRVASRNGGRLTANAVFARNFVREVEVFLPLQFLAMGGDGLNAAIGLVGLVWSGIFLLFPIFNKDKLRVGDLIAGTWVIHAPKTKLLPDIASASTAQSVEGAAFVFTPAQIDAYGIHELHILEDVLRRSGFDMKQEVAARIRKKIGWTQQAGEDDVTFLEAYYAALRQRLETRMLQGQKKIDKFDN